MDLLLHQEWPCQYKTVIERRKTTAFEVFEIALIIERHGNLEWGSKSKPPIGHNRQEQAHVYQFVLRATVEANISDDIVGVI
jgi:hypothetical protein